MNFFSMIDRCRVSVGTLETYKGGKMKSENDVYI